MHELILHHYPASPYSEKIRLILGFKSLSWRSVTIPAVMPKPDVIALTGGHRQTPLLQIGADVYCDTSLICRVIEDVAPEPTIYPYGDTLAIEALSRFADETLVSIRPPISSMRAEDLRCFFPGASSEWLEGYRDDRTAMRKGATKGRPKTDPTVMFAYLVPRLEAQFSDDRQFLFGDSPCIADFAAYHTCWVLEHVASLADKLSGFGRTLDWVRRMKAFGHGKSRDMSSAEAIEVARASGTKATVQGGELFSAGELRAGDMVEVIPTDHSTDIAARGELIAYSNDRVTVCRTDPRAGTIRVHFPRMGYQARKLG